MNAVEPASYEPTWYTATMVPTAAHGRLTFDLDVDVCVIGGGLAGLTTAREIARRGWSVAVLEGRRLAWNASGRNDGFVLPGFAESMERVVARVGIDHAKALWALSEMGLEYVRTSIAEADMPGVAPLPGWLKVSKVDRGDEMMADLELYGRLGAEVEGWSTERVRAVLKTDHYFHAMHLPRAFHIHPLNYALALAQAAEAAGARIFEDTPALSIDVDGVRKRIATPSARVRASHMVLACNVHLGTLVPRIVGTLIPVWALCAGHRAAGGAARRGDRLSRRRERHRPLQQSLSRGRRRPAHVVGSSHHLGDRSPAPAQGDDRRHRRPLSAAGRGRGRARLVGRARKPAAPDAADRRAGAGAVARQRLRRPRPQHHRHGGRAAGAGDRRGRRRLAAVRAVRAGVGGRTPGPRRHAGLLLVVQCARALRGEAVAPARAGISARARDRGAARGRGAGARGSRDRGGGAARAAAGRAGAGGAAGRPGARRRAASGRPAAAAEAAPEKS